MTALREILEDFGQPVMTVPEVTGIDEAQLEAEKLEAFDNGYRAGWDDAVKAQTEDSERISSAFAQNLQDLSFTYHEAYGQVMGAMTPLLEEIVSVLLPQMARAALAPQIAEQLQASARDIGQLDVIIAVAPGQAASVEPLLETGYGFPIRLVEDDTLTEGQADLRFGETERQIDLGAALQGVSDTIQAFIHENRRSRAHG